MHTKTSIPFGQKPGSKKQKILDLQHKSRWWPISFIHWINKKKPWPSEQRSQRNTGSMSLARLHMICASSTRSAPSHLVRVNQSGVWEMKWGDEQSDTLAFHPVPIQVVRDDPGHKVLASAGPAMEGQRQWLVGLWVLHEALYGFQDHRLGQVLPVEFGLKVPGKTWDEHRLTFKILVLSLYKYNETLNSNSAFKLKRWNIYVIIAG